MMAKGSHAQHRRMTIDIPAIKMKGPMESILIGCLCFLFRVPCAEMESVLKMSLICFSDIRGRVPFYKGEESFVLTIFPEM